MREYFDLDPGLIYLNSGTHSRCPRVVVESIIRNIRAYEQNPTRGVFQAWARLWEIQKDLARFFDADAHDLFLRPNVTAALNSFILGVDIPKAKGGEILISDLEYGGIVNLCRYRAERDGMSLRAFHLPAGPQELAGLSEEALADLIIRELRPETRMLMLSHIMTGTGLVLPLARIARETRRRGILFVVDGAHGPGALPLRFSELGDVDFYGGNLHKWMMAPKGTSFGWIHPLMRPRMSVTQAGWTTFEIPAPFVGFGEGDLFQAKMLNSACYDFAPFFALTETLAFWRKLGEGAIHARLRELQNHVIREIGQKLKWPMQSPADEKLRGPLVSFKLPPSAAAEGFGFMFRLERDHRIQLATVPLQGEFCLRFSPHIYNSEDEITRAIRTLEKLC